MYVRLPNRIQPSRSNEIACCTALVGTRYSQTTNWVVGFQSWKHWTLTLSALVVWRGGEFLKPPKVHGVVTPSQGAVGASVRFIFFHART